MTYALGRGLQPYDMPAVRAIVRDAAAQRLPFLVDRAGHRQQHAVSEAGRRCESGAVGALIGDCESRQRRDIR